MIKDNYSARHNIMVTNYTVGSKTLEITLAPGGNNRDTVNFSET